MFIVVARYGVAGNVYRLRIPFWYDILSTSGLGGGGDSIGRLATTSNTARIAALLKPKRPNVEDPEAQDEDRAMCSLWCGDIMTQVEMMRIALKELRGGSAEQLSAFLRDRFGLRIEPRFIPILRASVREKELQEAFRLKMQSAGAGAVSSKPAMS